MSREIAPGKSYGEADEFAFVSQRTSHPMGSGKDALKPKFTEGVTRPEP